MRLKFARTFPLGAAANSMFRGQARSLPATPARSRARSESEAVVSASSSLNRLVTDFSYLITSEKIDRLEALFSCLVTFRAESDHLGVIDHQLPNPKMSRIKQKDEVQLGHSNAMIGTVGRCAP